MSVTTIRAAIATRLATITGLAAYTHVPTNPAVPCAIVRPTETDYDLTIANGGDIQRYEILLLATSAGTPWDVAQASIDAYLDRSGASSVRAALQGDVTLGSTASTCRLTGWRDYGTLAYGGVEYFGVRFSLQVWAL